MNRLSYWQSVFLAALGVFMFVYAALSVYYLLQAVAAPIEPLQRLLSLVGYLAFGGWAVLYRAWIAGYARDEW